MKRRHVLHGLLASVMPLWPRGVLAASSNSALTLLVAGPDGAAMSRWGNACALALGANFPGGAVISPQPMGGLDGVTGANRLDALVVPDGKTAAILPGASLIAWLMNDPRVHFDPTHWMPLMAGAGSGVLVVRSGGGKPLDLPGLQARAPLRLAADAPQSNDLAALLALARLNVPVEPVFGLRDTVAKTNAFLAGAVDAVFLSGEGVPEDLAPLSTQNGVPIFTLGSLNPDGSVAADPLFPSLPDVMAFSGTATPFLDAAYGAAAAAARLDFLLVLPRLTDPDAVALWRQAASGALSAPALAAAASASAVTLQPAQSAMAALGAVNLVAADQLGLQAFLAKNFGRQPS